MIEEEPAPPFFRRALELGTNFFDTADMYSAGVSEEITGRALKAIDDSLPGSGSIMWTFT